MASSTRKRDRSEIKICSINICGMSNRSKFMLDKYANDEKFDAVAVQETGNDKTDDISLSNMDTITDSNLAVNRGAALFVKDNHSITKLEEISKDFCSIDSCWGLFITKGARYIIGTVYVKLAALKGISDVISMLSRAQELATKLKAKGVILLGDMNARHPSWGDSISNEYGNKLFQDLDSNQFTIMTSDAPSFLCTNGSSFIDLIIISNNIVSLINKIEADNEVELFSGAPFRGHIPVILTLKATSNESSSVIEKLSIKNVNWNKWAEEIDGEMDNNDILGNVNEDPESLLEMIEKILNDKTEKYGKKLLISSHSKPYWNDTLSILSKQLRRDRKTYSFRNNDRNKQKLIQSKEAFDQERKIACQNFIINKTKDLNAVEAHNFWKEFKRITTRKTNQAINPLEDGEGGIISEGEEMEKLLFSTFFECKHMDEVAFNQQFYEEINHEYEKIHEEEVTSTEEESDSDSQELNNEITAEEITKSIKESKSSGKSFDNHKCHPSMLKNLGPSCLNMILILFNLCFNMSLWIWDTAEVIFLKKAGKKSYSVPGSYRPISITAYMGKLLERILSIRLNKFLKRKRKFDPYQEGFSEKRNTIRYLNRLVLDIKTDIHKGKTVICLFLDFEKAFDSVWKRGLIVKLFLLGVKGKILKIIDNFLNTRKVCLNVNGRKGAIRNCSEYGLPQGSVLSPILFKIFMLDFLEDLNEDYAKLYKFADDGTVKISADTTSECLNQLQKVLDSLDEWAKKWRMVINCQPNKTEVVCFGTAENDETLIPKVFTLGDQTIKLVQQTKVLGIIIDNKLLFIEHSKEMYRKLTTRWNMIRLYCNRNWGFTQKVLVQLIRTLFVSCLMYGSHIWMTPQNMKEINSLYYKLLKTTVGPVFNIKRSIAEIILGLPPLAIQNKINMIKHYLKIIINDIQDDPLRLSIQTAAAQNPHPDIQFSLRAVFKFLKWKIQIKPGDFTTMDVDIINQNNFAKFNDLSQKCCNYTKTQITQYTELLWEESIRNEFQLEGRNIIPKPSCKPLVLSSDLNRTKEVKLMSLFYENNLLNSFLYEHDLAEVSSPICQCGEEEQTAFHIVTRCKLVNAELRSKAVNCIQSNKVVGENCTVLLNLSRNELFNKTLCDIIQTHSHILRTEVIL